MYFHPIEAPLVRRVTTERLEAYVIELGGVELAFRDFPALDRWMLALTLAVDTARAAEMDRTLAALREVSRPEPLSVLVVRAADLGDQEKAS